MDKNLDPALLEKLADAAMAARQNAHCPYSGFSVGAAVLAADGSVHSGVNVENASFGLTVCAERNAIASAVEAGMKPGGLSALAISTSAEKPTPPCGACRQVIAEFAGTDSLIISRTVDGQTFTWKLSELLPSPFFYF